MILTGTSPPDICTLVWPGWSQIGHKPKVGISQMGSNMLGMFLRMTVLGAGLIIPITLTTIMMLALTLPFGAWMIPYAAVPAGIVGGGVLVAEALLALRLAEPIYDRFDLSVEYR